MEKYIWIIIAAIGLSACGKTNEEKANELIKKELNKVIVNIDTYEPIETEIDSAFAPMQTPEVFRIYEGLPAQIEQYSDLEDRVNRIKRLMAIYERPYLPVEREQYNQYKQELESVQKQYDEVKERINSINDRLGEMAEQEPFLMVG